MSNNKLVNERHLKAKKVLDRIEYDYNMVVTDCHSKSIENINSNADLYIFLKWVKDTFLGKSKYEWFEKIRPTLKKDDELDFYISDRCLNMILEYSDNICYKLFSMLNNTYMMVDDITPANFENTLFSIIEVAEYNQKHNPQEYKEMFFTKDNISWQTTLVKFKNGLRAICINDKISEDDMDGSKQFMIFDPETREFLRSVNVDCWDNDLHNTLSLKGILGYMNLQMSHTTYQEHSDDIWADTEYDVVAVTKYIYACDAFENLFDPNVNWFYIRKEHGKLGSILTVGEAIKAEG